MGVTTVVEVLEALRSLSKEERAVLWEKLVDTPEIGEEIEDIATILERRDEPSRPYAEFVSELRGKNSLLLQQKSLGKIWDSPEEDVYEL